VDTTDLTERQVGDLAPGEVLEVLVDALPGQRLRGKVRAVAPMAEVVRGDVTYRATVTLRETGELPLRWGMTAFVAPAGEEGDVSPASGAREALAIAAAVAPRQDATLGFTRGGTVAEIHVAEGERVAAGEVLVTLEQDALESALRRAQAQLAAAEAAYEAALGGVADAEAAVAVAEGEVNVAAARLAQTKAGPAAEEIAAAESRLAAAESALAGAAAARTTVIEQPGIASQIESARGDLALAWAELRRLEEQYEQIIDTCYDTPDGEVCPLYGPVEETTRAQLEAARTRVSAAEAAVAELQSGATPAQLQAASGRVGAAAANRDLAAAQLALLQAGATDEQIRQAEVAVSVAQAQVAVAEARVARAEAAAAQADAGVFAAEAGVGRAEAMLAQATLRAPFAGIVASLNANPGELVGTARPVVVIAAEPWLVETTELTELDAAHVVAGDTVRVRFDALPGEEVRGTVERVALTAQNQNGDVVYSTRIRLEEAAEALPLRWGMSAEVDFSQ
jgi:HlyD family secretion protein